jgi:hypothetical protein
MKRMTIHNAQQFFFAKGVVAGPDFFRGDRSETEGRAKSELRMARPRDKIFSLFIDGNRPNLKP